MNNFTFKAQADGVHLYFYGDIVGDSADKLAHEDVCPVDVRDALEKAGDGSVTLHVNSGGGDVFAAAAICSMLAARKGRKTCYVDGLAASAASIIALSCDQVIMPKNAMLMIHRASVLTYGNAGELLDMAAVLEKIDQQMLDVYDGCRTENVGREQIKAMMDAETWLTAEEAGKFFANVQETEPMLAVARVNLPDSAPEGIKALMDREEEAERLRMRLALTDY